MAAAGGWGQGIVTLFSAQRLGMIRYGRWGLIVWRKDPKLHIGVAPLPYHKFHASTVATRISVLNKKSPYVHDAFNFIKFLASREYGNQINDSADNCSPVRSFLYEDRYLHNPAHPEEDYNQVFRDEMKYGRIQQISKFVNPFVADRIYQRYLDLMRNQSMTPQDAMPACAAEIDKAMQAYLVDRPQLKAEWEKLTGKKAELASRGGVTP